MGIGYSLVGIHLVSGGWLIVEIALKTWTDYKSLPPENQEKIREFVGDCTKIKQDQKSWRDMIYCVLVCNCPWWRVGAAQKLGVALLYGLWAR
jgi:hypothetical protein